MASLPPLRKNTRPTEKVKRRCPAHTKWVGEHACSVPNCTGLPIEVAHVRVGTNGGMGLKPSDRWVISFCRDHHSEQHRTSEQDMGEKYGDGPQWMKGLAEAFAARSPHKDKLRHLA